MQEWNKDDINENLKGEGDFILYLYTPLCGTCQVAGKMIEVVAELFPNQKWGKCDLNYIPNLALEWEVESVPCLLIFRKSEIIEKLYAFHSVPFLYETIKQKTLS